jgi:RND family efflux transporter MFP subunit
VEVREVLPRSVAYTVDAVGSVDAFERVQVTARLAGVVDAVRFAEGDAVREGQVLVEIEPDRYRVAAAHARSLQEKAEALKADAESLLARREGANAQAETGIYTQDEVESLRTRVRTATADVNTTRANLDMAELNLRDATVRAPFGGVIQTRHVQTGQYVQPGALLATFIRREPLLVRFLVGEEEAPRLQPKMPLSFTVRDGLRAFSAVITAVAEAADPVTRMVAVTARVDDPDRKLLRPGSFAQVTVPVGAAGDVPVIPQTAIRPSERGFLSFVVKGDKAVERVLSLGLRTPEGEVEVRAGLAAGESVVVRGAEALHDGAPVKVVTPGDLAPPGRPDPTEVPRRTGQSTPAPATDASVGPSPPG